MKIPAWCFVKAEMLVGCSVREWYKLMEIMVGCLA